MTDTYLVPTNDIAYIPDFQVRTQMDEDRIARYAEIIRECQEAGEESPFPPIELYKVEDPVIGEVLILVEGFHRFFAYQEAGEKEHLAVITEGTREDAMCRAMTANYGHEKNGIGLTRKERQYAFENIYEARKDQIGFDTSKLNEIAIELGVSERTARRDSALVKSIIKKERDKEILKLREEGLGVRDIAKEVGVGIATISRTINSVPDGTNDQNKTTCEFPEEPGADDDEIGFMFPEEEEEEEVVNPMEELNQKLKAREAKREQREKEAEQEDTTVTPDRSISDETVGSDLSTLELIQLLNKRLDDAGVLKILRIMDKDRKVDSAICELASFTQRLVENRG